jgi:Domain of unknown function (DUF4159)/Aerotolerance regulator N-terminal
MVSIGSIGFLFPIALSALVLLPLLWWLLRITPPRPKVVAFPALRLLFGLRDRQETPDKSPWWLIVLRTALAIFVIIAFAEPVLNPTKQLSSGSGALVIVIDDTWASAPQWKLRQNLALSLIEEARRTSRPVAIDTTAFKINPPAPTLKTAQAAKEIALALMPQPFQADRIKTGQRLKKALAQTKSPEVFWLSDGLEYGQSSRFSTTISSLGDGTGTLNIVSQTSGPDIMVLLPPVINKGDLILRARATRTVDTASEWPTVRAVAANGRNLGQATLKPAKDGILQARLTLPSQLRNDIRRLEITNQASAGAVFLLDDRWRRRPVGLVSGGSADLAQPLLAPLYYVERALSPYAEIRNVKKDSDTSTISALLNQPLALLILADVGKLVGSDETKVNDWVERGGILIRFAGPRLANLNDRLIPVDLRRGGRTLGGALTWSKPQKLAEFPQNSPFFGFKTPQEISITRQVLAEPTPDLPDKTWARLADGTPLVTASAKGSGMVVLFHVTANSDWSNLPLSGLFVKMLRRILDQSQVVNTTSQSPRNPVTASSTLTGTLPPFKTLDGFGKLQQPPATVEPVVVSPIPTTTPNPVHPPGLYGSLAAQRAFNVTNNATKLVVLKKTSDTATPVSYVAIPPVALKSWAFGLALILLLADSLAVLVLSGRLTPRQRAPSKAATIVLIAALSPLILALSSNQLRAQSSPEDVFALRASLITRLAYVITGDEQLDRVSAAGLTGLSLALQQRTSLEPGVPIGVNIESDELAFFPLLYWPISPGAAPLSDNAAARIDTYMKNGGTILFDTRDSQLAVPGIDGNVSGPGAKTLRELLSKLDIPPLEIVPASHVLTKAFYLLQSFPGRWTGGPLWVEAANPAAVTGKPGNIRSTNNDGVSTIIIGSNDYAASWARDNRNKYLFPVTPGGPRQREMAYRTGINIVMYALTGNYKADQVHLPALLERLGQ